MRSNVRFKKMKKIDPKSWRMWLLLCILVVVVIVLLIVSVDDLIFACRIRFGSHDAKQECSQWKESRSDGSPLPHPWWTYSCMLRDKDPWCRMVAAKLRYSLAPDDPRVLNVLIAEATNPDAEIRGAAVWEFWNMQKYLDHTLPVLERALFDDSDEIVRRSAFNCLLPLSRHDKRARALLERSATAHPVQATQEFAGRRLTEWDKTRIEPTSAGDGLKPAPEK